MNAATIIEWLPQPIGVALVIGFVPALIARCKRRPMTPWYLYGFLCALLAWPAVALPAIHALLVHGKKASQSQRAGPAQGGECAVLPKLDSRATTQIAHRDQGPPLCV
jgi:hypothetical protein